MRALLLGLIFASPLAKAQATMKVPITAPSNAPAEVKGSVWSFGITGMRHSLKAGDGNELLGNAGAIQLGTGWIANSWYSDVSLDILLGPYEPTRDKQLNVDYVGTGLTAFAGFSAQTKNLRSAEGGYGFALGLSYADTVGRSIGRNRKEGSSSDLIDNYTMRVTNFSLIPAIFFSWLKEARPKGNTPELLETRVEGYFLTIGMAMPLLSSYSAKYDKRGSDEASSEEDSGDGVEEKDEKGQLRGYSIMVALKSMLGT